MRLSENASFSDNRKAVKKRGSMVKLNAAVATDVGKIRLNNEDNFYFNGKYKEDMEKPIDFYAEEGREDNYTYAVCDGMGGEEYGEMAAYIAVKNIKKYDSKDLLSNVDKFIQNTNQLICDEIEKNGGARMGTTLALLHIKNNKAYCYNIGDSRIYFYHCGKLLQLTKDHTQAQSMVDMGLLKYENMNAHKGKHRLTQHLGIFPEETIIQPFESEPVSLEKNDVFIICSDGVTDMLSEDELIKITESCVNSKKIVDMIINMAVDKGGKDNITVIAIQVEEIVANKQKLFWSKILKK